MPQTSKSQKCIKVISIVLLKALLLVCQRCEGEEHASVLSWLTGGATPQICTRRLFVPEPFVHQTSPLHPEDSAAALYQQGQLEGNLDVASKGNQSQNHIFTA